VKRKQGDFSRKSGGLFPEFRVKIPHVKCVSKRGRRDAPNQVQIMIEKLGLQKKSLTGFMRHGH
jgi:hypothetical protein